MREISRGLRRNNVSRAMERTNIFPVKKCLIENSDNLQIKRLVCSKNRLNKLLRNMKYVILCFIPILFMTIFVCLKMKKVIQLEPDPSNSIQSNHQFICIFIVCKYSLFTILRLPNYCITSRNESMLSL